MIGYCPAVYLICYFLLYVTIPYTVIVMYMFQTLLYLDRGRSEFRVETEWGRKFQWGFRGKDRLFTALSMIRYFLYHLT